MMQFLSDRKGFSNSAAFLAVFFLLWSLFVKAQEKGISMLKENSKKVYFINENKRVIVKTSSNNKLIGNYTIVDNKTILIKNQIVSLDSIQSIRKYSRFSSVASPVFIGTGSLFVSLGVAGLIAGSYGVIFSPLIPLGLPMVLFPVFANKHKSKYWEYKIVN
jgi:hypothetical protein